MGQCRNWNTEGLFILESGNYQENETVLTSESDNNAATVSSRDVFIGQGKKIVLVTFPH